MEHFVEKSLLFGSGGVTLADIEAALGGTKVRRVMKYWRGLSDTGLPSRSDFDPADLGRALSNVFLAEKLEDGDYLFRVSGTFITAVAGFDASMRRMSECDAMVGREEIRRVYDETLASLGPRLDFMRVPWRHREWLPVERLLLPLVDDQGAPRFLIGASDHWIRRDGD